MRVSVEEQRPRSSSSLLGNTADLAEQPSGGLHLGINGAIGNLGANDGLEEGNGLVIPALADQQLTESHTGASEHDQILGLDGGIDGIAQGGLGELGAAASEELTGALEVAGDIHGEEPKTHGEGQHDRGRVIPGGMDAESRIVELELRYMQQQELLQELSDALYAQQRELDALRAELEHVKKKLEGEPGLVDARQQEKPPHY